MKQTIHSSQSRRRHGNRRGGNLLTIGTLAALISAAGAVAPIEGQFVAATETAATETNVAETNVGEITVGEITIGKIEREAVEIVRVYVGLREIVNSRAADECCKEMITQLVVPIWQQRDAVSPRQHASQFIAVYETLTYEFQVRAARHSDLKKLYPHFRDAIVSDLVPLPRGYQR